MPRPKKDTIAAMTLVAKDLLENNQSVADIGVIVGALGEDSLKWLKDLKAECSSVDEFIELATKRADIALIVAAVKTALGYEYEESYQNYLKVPDGYNDDGSPRLRDVPGNRQVKKRRALPNESLLRFILKCRLPEYFTDTQRIEINKKTIEIKEIAQKEIEEFGRKLIESFESKGTDK